MNKFNKHGYISDEYLQAIGFNEEGNFVWHFRLGKLTIILNKENLYFSIAGLSKKPEFYSNVNYKNIEDKFAEIIYKNT